MPPRPPVTPYSSNTFPQLGKHISGDWRTASGNTRSRPGITLTGVVQNMIHANDDTLQVSLTPDDVDSAQMAGVRFARALAGTPSVAFMLALGEQEQLVRAALTEAGVGQQTAGTAADAFEVGARLEWTGIAPSAVQGLVGRA